MVRFPFGAVVATAALAAWAVPAPASAQIIPRSMEVDLGAGYYWFVTNLENLHPGPAFGGRVGINIVEYLAVEGTFHYVPTYTWHGDRVGHYAVPHFDFVIHTTPWRVVPYFAVGAGFQVARLTRDFRGGVEPAGEIKRRDPFASDDRVGLGDLRYMQGDRTQDFLEDFDFVFDVGGGLKFLIFDRGGLRLDARYVLSLGSADQDDGVPAWIDETDVVEWRGNFHHVELTGAVFFLLGGGPGKDSDGDGVPDQKDLCKDEPEDKDGTDDADGCPDRDDDGDGVPDTEDECRNQAEDKDGFQDGDGCLDADNDADGLRDGEDGCPDQAEDGDGFQDGDGCPDPDNDGDGIQDARDGCPMEGEDKDGFRDDDGCPEPDNDGDGIGDNNDACPNAPEQMNGLDDTDGCPEIDADGDGVYDEKDRCPEGKEDLDGFEDTDGCPDPDNDKDGLMDREDVCPMAPEDADGFDDGDGCPEFDNDEDGLPDGKDQCPDKAEDDDGWEDLDGCPEYDNDKDGVLDGKDKCPNNAEVFNGFDDEDGCPDDIPEKLKKFTGAIADIQFKNDSDELLSSSFTVLNQAANVLTEFPTVHLEIQGHASSDGDDTHNMDLSQRRADSVRRYLVGRGVEGGRLTAIGYGETIPVDTNKTDSGRARNRRVEFKIVQ